MSATPPPPNSSQPAPAGRPPVLEYLKSKEFYVLLGIILGGGLLLMLIFFYLLLPLMTNHNEQLEVPRVASDTKTERFVSLEEAEARLLEVGLAYEVIDSSQYVPEYPPLAVIGQEPEAGSAVKPGRKIYLKVNRARAPMVKFPDIVDLSYSQGRYTLENWRLHLGSTRVEPGLGDNLILRAYYQGRQLSAGDLVPEQSKIDLVVSQQAERGKMKMPEVTGKPIDQAMAELQRLGLMPRPRFRTGGSPAGVVLKQIPAARDSVAEGSVVILEITK
ncbi:MAG: PASTA domain-containing protein [Sphingobacteriia bacterium]